MILESIINRDIVEVHRLVTERMNSIAKQYVEMIRENDYEEMLFEKRFAIVNRIRNGKVQRRKKVSQVQGYRFQDGRLVRMSPKEKLNRKRAQRKGALKRKGKIGISLRRRKISMKRRGRL
jgi:hypothetical protein